MADPEHSASTPSQAATNSDAASHKGFKRIAVFCGASTGSRPEYVDCATALGQEMVRRGIGLVYGGGNVGLMGAIAQTVRNGLGDDAVIGVIPAALEPREVSGGAIGQVRVVPDMHTRKAVMSAEADAFIAIPGGFGTLEEVLEMVTWQQLGIHAKPVGFLNACGFYDHLLKFFDHCTQEGFIRQASRAIVVEATQPGELIDKLLAYTPPRSIIELAAKGLLGENVRG